MRIRTLFFVLLIAMISVLAFGGCCTEHVGEVLPAVAPTCTEVGLSEGLACAKCGKILTAQKEIAAKGHTEVNVKAVAATCTEDGRSAGSKCSACETVLRGMEVIPAGHDVVQQKAKNATCLVKGLSAGSYCAACNTVLEEQTVLDRVEHDMMGGACRICGYDGTPYADPAKFISDSSYNYLGSCEDGAAMQALYREADIACSNFHYNSRKNASVDNGLANVVTVVNYAELGLTLDQAVQVWNAYRDDHPLYYWLHYGYSYNKSSIVFRTTEEYALGNRRAALNQLIYDGMDDLLQPAADAKSRYELALALYDGILEHCEYAYSADGSEAETSL